ncbi:hypothetical protein [Flagellimonas sp.]|uniref:hypothetical protein n=1 Tax=Flagellimonas sp. TaxID=2058762 RepID=UPI003BA99012
MKKVFLLMVLMATIVQVCQAQERGKFRVGFDFGNVILHNGGGLLTAFEPKQNLTDNMNIGFRFENVVIIKKIDFGDDNSKKDLSGGMSFIGTFDRYFNKNNSMFSPFIGGGLGYNIVGNAQFSVEDESGNAELSGKLGGLVRAGFELGKLRMAATYNLIGKSEIGEGAEAVEVKNSYLGISLGFYLGGGKWKK